MPVGGWDNKLVETIVPFKWPKIVIDTCWGVAACAATGCVGWLLFVGLYKLGVFFAQHVFHVGFDVPSWKQSSEGGLYWLLGMLILIITLSIPGIGRWVRKELL